MDKQILIDALVGVDSARPRSLQKAIGVSSLGDCRRKVWHYAQGTEITNPNTLKLSAIFGTAIHAAIEASILTQYENRPEIDRPMIEHRIELDGLPPATIDFYDPVDAEVVDWKTITLKNVDYFVSQQKRWQVQVYGYLLEQSGFPVRTVTLVGIPRDGNESNIVVHSEPYDSKIALEALSWLEDVVNRSTPPSPEREVATFCKNYCPFFGACPGIGKDLSGEPITDPIASEAAKRYVEISDAIKKLETEKEATKSALEGVSGITIDGIKVVWSEVAGRKTPDTDEILKLLQTHVDESMIIPTKTGASSVRLSVK